MRNVQEVRDELRRMGAQMRAQAAKQLHALKAATNTALQKKDLEAITASLPPIDAVLAKDKGWPRQVLPDRRGLLEFVRDARAEVKNLRAAAASAAKDAAWRTYLAGCNGQDGILARVRRFDLDGAEAAARDLANKLGEQAAGLVGGSGL